MEGVHVGEVGAKGDHDVIAVGDVKDLIARIDEVINSLLVILFLEVVHDRLVFGLRVPIESRWGAIVPCQATMPVSSTQARVGTHVENNINCQNRCTYSREQ